jgi:uncharacterized membrane protein required for colicin V production
MLNNFLDILILSIIVISTLWGFFLGFILSLLFLIAIFFGKFIITVIFPNIFAPISAFISHPLIEIFLLLFVFFLLITISRSLLYRFFPSSVFNRVLGGLLGFFTGIFLSNLLFQVISKITHFQDEINSSSLTPYIIKFSENFLL